jgi:NADH dehydrogenase
MRVWQIQPEFMNRSGEKAMLLVTGGTGFVGHNLVKRLREEGRGVRCLVRSGESAYLSELGAEVVRGDVLDPASLSGVMNDCRVVIHLVGVWRASRDIHRRLHIQGTANVVEAAKAAGVRRFIYISAMGVSLGIPTTFYQTKGESEGAVKRAGLEYIIFRPAVIIGPGDEFTTALVDMIKKSPVVPVLGDGRVRFQPLWVGDMVDCLAKAVDPAGIINRTYDIAGPDILSYDQLLDTVMQVLGVSKPKVHLPLGLISPLIRLAGMCIPNLPISYDELKIMRRDNVADVSEAVRDFDLKQTGFRQALSRYLP